MVFKATTLLIIWPTNLWILSVPDEVFKDIPKTHCVH